VHIRLCEGARKVPIEKWVIFLSDQEIIIVMDQWPRARSNIFWGTRKRTEDLNRQHKESTEIVSGLRSGVGRDEILRRVIRGSPSAYIPTKSSGFTTSSPVRRWTFKLFQKIEANFSVGREIFCASVTFSGRLHNCTVTTLQSAGDAELNSVLTELKFLCFF
jgi:hypothetical protein